jgi:osmotically inducible protein OsmC
MKRSATAVWSGSLKDGNGHLTSPSGILHSTQYSFGSRFETGPGINPEELIAGAHAGCYAMALAGLLSDAGFPPDQLEVTAEITVENTPPAGWTIAASHLKVSARVLNLTSEKLATYAEEAKSCPVSRVLQAAVTLEAKLM